MEKVVSGIRPTGRLHLGNYFGAIVNFVKMQHDFECLFFIADIHSLTTHPTPEYLYENNRQTLIEYLAAGIDPEKANIYIQSDVPEIFELYTLLNMNAYIGELSRTTSFKDKVKLNPDNVNAGLLTYPVLMAADIIIHHASKVPVGKDQEQNLEMARVFARRFNHIYKVDYFKEPDAFNFGSQLVKIQGLDGSGKMGKSEGNGIFLADDAQTIRKKIMRAVTDSGPTPNAEMSAPVKNLFSIMNIVSKSETVQFFEDSYMNCTIRYGDLKKQLADDVVNYIAPITGKINELSRNTEYLSKIAEAGAEKARESASKTIKEVREIIGIKKI